MNKPVLAAFGVIGACAAACAIPIALPLISGVLAAAVASQKGGEVAGLLAGLAVAALLLGALWWRKRHKAKNACESSACDVSRASGCACSSRAFKKS